MTERIPRISRRDFLRLAGVGAAGVAVGYVLGVVRLLIQNKPLPRQQNQ